MQIDFFNSTNLSLFWSYVKMLLEGVAPGVMIAFAVVCVGFLLGIIVKAWNQSAKEEEERDYDYREY
ncbi:hypothetical protein M3205_23245 [Cytobacillus firmus]|uniref:hypothetical protein n=1 Tax=Cytobacillus TaxID=2675230 RepID=UPI00091FDA66|nr:MULTISPECIES: hypothetical protein [Cytobacillus]MBU8733700.1 hypothetical protein [Cytobacillus oceanisediminis]MCM3708562.1 hypothetical protein [Cytobacillus firmus]MCS0827821.1 hypothetical protein [Cytobacillus firmus]SGI71967.1 Uncharacterised protein [Mycobacterium tuberculosis]